MDRVCLLLMLSALSAVCGCRVSSVWPIRCERHRFIVKASSNPVLCFTSSSFKTTTASGDPNVHRQVLPSGGAWGRHVQGAAAVHRHRQQEDWCVDTTRSSDLVQFGKAFVLNDSCAWVRARPFLIHRRLAHIPPIFPRLSITYQLAAQSLRRKCWARTRARCRPRRQQRRRPSAAQPTRRCELASDCDARTCVAGDGVGPRIDMLAQRTRS